jgi:hypothetical protein
VTDGQLAVSRAAEAAIDHRGHRLMWACLMLVVIGVTAVGIVVWSVLSGQDEQGDAISSLELQADRNAVAAQQLANQVRDMGGQPVVQPPSPGERGPAGAQGPEGVSGPSGPPGPIGPGGPAGAPSSPGTAGEPGADGVQGPAGSDGAAGANGAPGPAGPQGPQGPQGDTGPAGAPGPACPAGYESRPAVITAPGGSTYQGVACVDPGTEQEPPLLPIPLGG